MSDNTENKNIDNVNIDTDKIDAQAADFSSSFDDFEPIPQTPEYLSSDEILNSEDFEIEELSDDFNDNSDFEYDSDDNDDFAYTEYESDISDDISNSELEQVSTKNSGAFKLFMKKCLKPAIITGSILFALCLALYVAGIATLPHDTVMKNMYVEDVYVGGMTYDEVLKAMEQTYLLENQKITVSCNGSDFVINGNDIGMAASPIDTAKKVYNYGKSGNMLTDGFKNALRIVKKRVIIPVAQINQELLATKINDFGIELYGEMIGHYVEINETDTTATIWPGHTGYNPNDENSYKEACKIVTDAISKDKYNNIYLPLSKCAPPDITLETFDGLVYADPQNAQYKIENNNVEVIPEITGRYINKEEAAALLPLVKEGGEVIKIPYYVSYADVTAQVLSDKLFANTLASFSTNYGSSTYDRARNVARAAALINGKVLAPDEIFSFNDTVGDRTASNGFYPATEYVNGKSVQGIGGGTCQVSTTLYSAVLYADLQIVHRENHVMTVGYVPLGQDATVAYGSVDFKFKNTTAYPVKIVATTNGGVITVSIVGTDWEPKRTVELKHSVSYVGEDTSVVSTRYVYENGELISTDPLGRSYYKPHKEETEEEEPEETQASSEESSSSDNSESSSSSEDTQAETAENQSTQEESVPAQSSTEAESDNENI